MQALSRAGLSPEEEKQASEDDVAPLKNTLLQEQDLHVVYVDSDDEINEKSGKFLDLESGISFYI